VTKERDVNAPGGGHNLRDHWVRGPGAAEIGWGTEGSMKRCIAKLSSKGVRDPGGLCAEYHHAATGEWPRGGTVPSANELEEFDVTDSHGNRHSSRDGKFVKKGGGDGAAGDIIAVAKAFDGKSDMRIVKKSNGKYHTQIRKPGEDNWKKMGVDLKNDEDLDDYMTNGMLRWQKSKGEGKSESESESSSGKLNIQHGSPPDDFQRDKALSISDENLHRKLPKGTVIAQATDSDGARRLVKGDDEDIELHEWDTGSNTWIVSNHDINYDDDDIVDDDWFTHPGLEIAKMQVGERGKYVSDVITAAKNGKKTDCPPGQHRMPDGSCMDDDSPKMDTYALGDGDEPWDGVLSVEGIESGDGRLFALGSLDWEKPPQPLMYQPANVGGHNGSFMVGQIQSITRHGSRIRGKGVVFGSALKSDHGESIRHMMSTGGVSVDVDKVKDADVEMVYADGDVNEGGGGMFTKPETTIFHRGRIRGATLVAFPAFVEAKLGFTNTDVVTASSDPESCGCESSDPLVAAAHTITIPNLPKAEWFNEPTDVKLVGALTITDEGRVYGVLAPGGVTHRSVKKKVPRGNVDYTRFHKGETIVEGGGRVVTGVITAACGHAPTENYGTLQNRRDHYDNSCSVLANIRVGESRQGYVWAAGALNPGADPRQVAQALGCALSGDWQPHPDRPGVQDFISAHLVPVPGFPMARTQASVVYQDGVITASSVPVQYVSKPEYVSGPTFTDAFNAITFAKNVLAASIGMDPSTRKRQLAAELEMM
jgi:hypothetical protein